MRIELKHLAPYLPYKLRLRQPVRNLKSFRTRLLTPNNLIDTIDRQEYIKPILKHISVLTDEFSTIFKTLKGKSLFMDCENSSYSDFKIECYELINNTGSISISYSFLQNNERIEIPFIYNDYQFLFKNHIDIFGLIDSGVAVSS